MHKVVADEKVCHGFFVVQLSMIGDTSSQKIMLSN